MSTPDYVIEHMPTDALISHAKALQAERKDLRAQLAEVKENFDGIKNVLHDTQKQLAAAQTMNAGAIELVKELERKLAEQQANVEWLRAFFPNTKHNAEMFDARFGNSEELTKLLTEAREQAVPDWFIKWYVSEREARFVFASTRDRDAFVRIMIGAAKTKQEAYRDTDAAPSPANAKEGGE